MIAYRCVEVRGVEKDGDDVSLRLDASSEGFVTAFLDGKEIAQFRTRDLVAALAVLDLEMNVTARPK